MKVLLTVEPRAYREAIGLAIENLRPHVEVIVSGPEDLLSKVARLVPTLVICGLPDFKTSGQVAAWVELESAQGSWQRATVRIRDQRSKIANVQLEDLLLVVDHTEEAAREDIPLGDRYGHDVTGR